MNFDQLSALCIKLMTSKCFVLHKKIVLIDYHGLNLEAQMSRFIIKFQVHCPKIWLLLHLIIFSASRGFDEKLAAILTFETIVAIAHLTTNPSFQSSEESFLLADFVFAERLYENFLPDEWFQQIHEHVIKEETIVHRV